MPINKYISTKDAVRLTGLSTQEIYDLIHNGTLPARKAPKSGWRIMPQDLAGLGLIKNESDSIEEVPQTEDYISYVADEEHYSEVFKRMTEVKHSLKIATANLKNFSVTIESDSGDEKLRLCDFFLLLVERGVHVQVVCMKPFGFYLYTKENCPQLLDNPLFELRYNEHNHMKLFVFDDECAYIGSANITSAAIGMRVKRNHEAGMLVSGENLIMAPLRHFEKVWDNPDIFKHTWKRFTKMAKELEKAVLSK
ncbi:phospholipase D-like domain-containing protein [uncultured Prevotella sp.]|uniref:phospholipase D-like domain-containing protein n=1 Tax=uncultured Prevotella sp. TaxID=159272 RepID=UPI0025F96CE1|nr:phospholipase D-like domain-containing protein [uncultured Prevotella sp.]